MGNEVRDREATSRSVVPEKRALTAPGHKLGTARGILIGLLLGAFVWLAVGLLILFW